MDSKGGSLKSTSVNGVKVYSITGNRSVATWLPPKKLQALRKDKEYLRRVELIQDLGFETATTKIKATPDGEYLIASGIYPPQVKVYELRELSMKFERHLTSEIVNFQILGDDYSKLAFLCADRSVCLHAKYGSHYSLRIPRMGRDVAYDRTSCDLLCAASSPDLYRISLEQGRFLSPLASQSPAINVVRQSKVHGLVACGGEDGYVECFDLRAKSAIGRIDAVSAAGDANEEVTALQFDESGGYHLAVGSSAGKVFIYDLRQAHPIRVKDHMYGSPIIDIKWHQTINAARPKIVTTDKKIVRIWDPDTGDTMAGIEPTAGNINDICIFGESGLMLLALDGSQIPSYFIPALGPAPEWCVNLENLTEELEESAETTIYDHFKFLTYGDIQRLKLQNLIGTNLLRAYMHGFFMDYRVYQKALTLADPFAYDTYRKQRIQEKLEKERVARIAIKRKLPKVNKELAARLIENAEARNDEAPEGASKKSNKKKGMGDELLKDERFSALFSNQDFEVDEHSREYLALHPAIAKKQPSLIEEHFEPLSDDEEDQSMSGNSAEDQADEIEDDTSRRTPRLLAVKDARHADAFRSNTSLASEEALPLGERAAILEKEQATKETTGMKKGHGGSREMSFTVRNRKHGDGEIEGDRQGMKRKSREQDTEGDDRRGMRSLGFNPDRQSFRGRGRGRGGRNHGGGGGRGRGRGRGRSNGRGRGRS